MINNELRKRRRFSKEEKEKVLAKTACKCGRCGKKLEIQEATIDHIIPLNKGGLNDEFNLVGLCIDCNGSKSNFMYNMLDYYIYAKDKNRALFYISSSFSSKEKIVPYIKSIYSNKKTVGISDSITHVCTSSALYPES